MARNRNSEARQLQLLKLGQVSASRGYAAFDFLFQDPNKRVAPTEFRVFPAGTFTTTKGDFQFTARSAELVMEYFAKRANPLMGDYEHQTDATAMGFPPIEAPASITEMVPEVRMNAEGLPELWVTSVRWTDRARGMLEAGEYRMFSPTFMNDKETGEIIALLRIALTNDPAINALEPLVAASSAGAGADNNEDEEEDTMADKETCSKCSATEAHLSDIKGAHEKMGKDHEALLKANTELLAAHTALAARMKSFEDWAAEEADEHGDDEESLTATLTAASGGKRPETAQILTALSARRKAARSERSEIVTLTGGKGGAAMLGTVKAWAEQVKELNTLKAKVESEQKTLLTAQYKDKADKAVTEAKMSPAQRKACDDVLAKSGVDQAMVMLSVIVPEGATAIVTTDGNGAQQVSASHAAALATLSAGELAEAKKMNISIETLAAAKAASNKAMDERRRISVGR